MRGLMTSAVSDPAVRWVAWLRLHTLTHTLLIPRFIISLELTHAILPRYTALRFIRIHMVGIGVGGYFFPADSQLVSARVHVLAEAGLSMNLVNTLRRSIRRASSLV
jgi:hypothetical protein